MISGMFYIILGACSLPLVWENSEMKFMPVCAAAGVLMISSFVFMLASSPQKCACILIYNVLHPLWVL